VSAAGLAAAMCQTALVVAVAPLVVGLMRRVRARLEGRAGPPLTQPWRDIRKQMAKERIIPANASWVFPLAPLVLVASAAVATLILPFLTTRSGLDQIGDLFALVYLLLLGTVFLALAGLDTGTAFGGMGSSREMTVAAVAEPTILVAIFALSVTAGSSNLAAIVTSTLDHPSAIASPESVLAFAALGVVTLAETGRLPVDNPSTHLELTMIHEAMILEYAGPDLALVELAAHMRLVVFLGLLANLFVPWGIATSTRPLELLGAAGAVSVKIAVLGVAIAAFEVFVAKLRLFRVPELLAASFVLAFLAVTASFFLA
jgi:formate hydrogenlyase subunit 4